MAGDTTSQDTAAKVKKLAEELEAELKAEAAAPAPVQDAFAKDIETFSASIDSLTAEFEKAIEKKDMQRAGELRDQAMKSLAEREASVAKKVVYARDYLDEAEEEALKNPAPTDVAEKAQNDLEREESYQAELASYGEQLREYFDGWMGKAITQESVAPSKTQEQQDQEQEERAAGEGMVGTIPPSVVTKIETKPMTAQERYDAASAKIKSILEELSLNP